MGLNRRDESYRSFDYLRRGEDYRAFRLAAELERVEQYRVPLTDEEEARAERLARDSVVISLHEHAGTFPADIAETPAYVREGRVATAFEGLAASCLDAVFDNLLDGICTIRSRSGWQWDDVLHDLGIRLCDLAHQDFVVHCTSADDIRRAHAEGRVAWIASMEGAAMIENELDRIDLLYGFGVRALGVTYSEANALGSGLKEPRDGGLTAFGREAVRRMNRVGMLIDCSHAGDRTTLDTIEVSEKPIVLSHIGARALWDSNRLAPDEVIDACAERGGVIGVEAAPHTTLTERHREHTIDSVMEHFEYIADRVGIEHVTFGPDTVYGDHTGLHRVYAANLSIEDAHRRSVSAGRADGGDADGATGRNGGKVPDPAAGDGPGRASAPRGAGNGAGRREREHPRVAYVKGMENPTEASHNIIRWLVKHGYSDDEIGKVVGGNVLRVLEEVWE